MNTPFKRIDRIFRDLMIYVRRGRGGELNGVLECMKNKKIVPEKKTASRQRSLAALQPCVGN